MKQNEQAEGGYVIGAYVIGFYFSENLEKLVLLRKQRPDWQKGKLNGVGGKVENFDPSAEATMIREFQEETGKRVEDWNNFCTLEYDQSIIWCYVGRGDLEGIHTVTDEPVVFSTPRRVQRNPDVMPELKWLVPMAIGSVEHPEEFMACKITRP